MNHALNVNNDNTFIFSFVRMNPATPGHLILIKTMIYKAIELGTNNVYVITSSTLDGKNPLPCSRDTIPKPKNKSDANIIAQMHDNNLMYKSYILHKMVDVYKRELIDSEFDQNIKQKIANINVFIICSIGNPFSFLYSIIQHNFIDKGISKINLFFIVGRDRADFLDTIVDNFKTKNFIKSIDGFILAREGMEALKNTGIGTRSISDINPSEYSASFIRNLVKKNLKNEFTQVYSKYLTPDEIDKLFETIKLGTQMKTPPSKEEDENPQSKYFDRGLLPIIVSGFGGKKYKKNTKKYHKKRKQKKYTRRYK